MTRTKHFDPGTYINSLKILRFAGTSPSGKDFYECECRCGNTFVTYRDHIISGRTKTCQQCAKSFDIKGEINNGWRAEQRDGRASNGEALWLCRCETCGRTMTVRSGKFRKGKMPECSHDNNREEESDFPPYIF